MAEENDDEYVELKDLQKQKQEPPKKKFFERVKGSYGGQFLKQKYGEFKEKRQQQKDLTKAEREAYLKEKQKQVIRLGKKRAKIETSQQLKQFKQQQKPRKWKESSLPFGMSPDRKVLDFRPSGMAFGMSKMTKNTFGNLGEHALKDRYQTGMYIPKMKLSNKKRMY